MPDKEDESKLARSSSSYDDGTTKAESELRGPPAEKIELERTALAADQQRETNRQTRTENKLRNTVALAILVLTTVQIGVVDVGFFLYGDAMHWHIPAAAISAWIGGLVAEVVSLAVVIVRYLFPERGRT